MAQHFRALIIKRNTLITILSLISVGAVTAFSAHKTADSENTEAVSAFSQSDAVNIIKEGVPNDNDGKSVKEILNKLLGFDADKPETIIKSSSSVLGDLEQTEAEQTAENKKETKPPLEDSDKTSLPSHEQICSADGLKINNATNYNVNLDELCTADLAFKLAHSEEPEVLVIHTHTTECFIGDEMSGESERTTNESYNMCAVGDVICDNLESYGIHTVHDKTIHDYPSYQGSYTRALETIEKNLASYPSIKVVLDMHRDAYVYSDGSKLRVAQNINGKAAAQVMLVLGTDSMGLSHPEWMANLTFAAKIQSAAEIMYPGLMRPVNLRRERFNMHVTTGSLLLEIGSNGNTLDEAKLAGEYVAKAIAAVLTAE